MADPCVVGVKMKIHRFDIITKDGNMGSVWNIDREHCASISCSLSVYILPLYMLVDLWEFAMMQVFAKLSIYMEVCWVLLICDHDFLCFVTCNSYIFVHDSVFHWYIIMWHLSGWRSHISGVVLLCLLWTHLWVVKIVNLLPVCVCLDISIKMKCVIWWYG